MSRYILVIQSSDALVRAGLVTRELRIVASAHQNYQVSRLPTGAREFDPLEVWYKTKQVIAACLDIGRTLPREILSVALVGQGDEAIVWFEQDREIVARGVQFESRKDFSPAVRGLLPETCDAPIYFGAMNTWLLWNLTGEYVTAQEIGDWRVENLGVVMPQVLSASNFPFKPKTRVRAPLGAPLDVTALVSESGGEGDDGVIGAAKIAFGE